MTYFKLRKQADEPELEEVEETEEEPEEAAGEPDEEARKERTHGPIVTGLLGPWQWLAAHFNLDTAVIVHVGAVGSAVLYGGWVAVSVAAAWLGAVLLFVPREHKDRAAAWFERRSRAPAAPLAEAPPGGSREGILRLLRDLIGEGRGVHLATVLAHLQEHGQWEGKEVADLRRHLEALGIPVQPKLKIAGTPTRGVAKADLDALPPLWETPPSPSGRLPI